MVRIRLLGGVDAFTDDGLPIDVGAAKCQAVLAALAFSVGSAVPVSRLVEVVWGEDPPRTAERTLQSYVTRLRKALGADAIVRTGAAYRLEIPAAAVDAARFQQHLDAGDVEAALAEWTGVPLAGLDAPGLTPSVDALVEQWLTATESDLELKVDTDPAATIGSLTQLTAIHPFREGFWALLMTALYRVGRQADALSAYRSARVQLIDNLGVEPGPRLRELETMILGQDSRLRLNASPNAPALGEGPAQRPTGTATFAFAQVAESTLFWNTQRPEMTAVAAHLNGVAAGLTKQHNGLVFAATGDIVAAAFHRAADAAAYATDLQSAMTAEQSATGVEIGVGVGLHTGDTEEAAHGYYGAAVNLASHLAGVAGPGQTLTSEATSTLLDSDLRCLGTYRVDGVSGSQRLFQLGQREHPALNLGDGRKGNLPRRRRQLVGRDQDVAVVADALAASPLVTLIGPGGIGKTSLAMAVAQQAQADLADGAWMIELAEITSPDDIPLAVADCLGVKETPGRTLTQSLLSVLQTRQMLLVLDNCEHVIDSAAEFANAITRQSPHVRLLATSREPLGVPDERRVAVEPLEAGGPATELFNKRAAMVSPGFDPNAERDAVVEICRRLDGIPLAIELAAARVRTLSVLELLDRLDKRLRLLGGDHRAGTERHRTLSAVVHWSYDLLTPPQQTLFADLSIFAGPFDLSAAETVAAGTNLAAIDADRLLDDLVERSMVIVESGPFGRRFRLLETIRQFAAERLTSQDRSALIAERHARWCLHEVTRIGRLLAGQAEVEGVARLTELRPNLRSAFDWACAADDYALAHALVRPVVTEVVLRSRQEIGDWLERVLAITPAQDVDIIVSCLTWTARRFSLTQNHEAYEQLLERYGEPDHPVTRHARAFVPDVYEGRAELAQEAAAVLRSQGDDFLAELAQIDVGASLLNIGHYDELDSHLTALLDRYRSQGPPTCLNWTLMLLGYSATFQVDPDRADRYFEEAVSVDVPDRTYSPNKPIEARMLFRQGEHARAFRVLRSNIDDLLDTDNMQAASITCIEFINMMAALDRLDATAHMLAYLETTGLLDAPAWRTLIADATAKVADNKPDARKVGATKTDLDDRQALNYMRGVLDQLTATETPPA